VGSGAKPQLLYDLVDTLAKNSTLLATIFVEFLNSKNNFLHKNKQAA